MPAETGLGHIAESLRRSTVQVEWPDHRAGGSGVIWSADGKIVTNAHVVQGERALVRLWDGRQLDAQVLARDSRRDLASLTVAGQELAPAVFRDSGEVQAGEFVVAIGNPLGFVGALSTGVVHAVAPLPGRRAPAYVQAAVRLAPGNSGGPLADSAGRVIGINSMVMYGLGLAVPSNTIAQFMERGPAPAPLGVTVRPLPVVDGTRPSVGLLVLEVRSDSPAANASLLPGDILVGVDGRPLQHLDDLGDALDQMRGPLRLQFLRGGARNVREVTIST